MRFKSIVSHVFVSIATLLVVGMLGCSSANPGADYVKRDRATYNAIKPRLDTYVADHPTDKEGTDDVVASWRIRLEAGEAANPTTK